MSVSTFTTASRPHGSLSEVNKATQRITKRNDQSPFFKLPPEIRTQIYGLCLGGQEVHVNLCDGANWLYVCQATTTTEDDIFDQYKTSKTAPRYLHQHRPCEPATEHHPLSEYINLPLLRVCRKIYNEAALMPFSSNHFMIRDMRRLQRFVERLSPTQQRAVKELTFITTEPERPVIPSAPFIFDGLRHFRVRMEFIRGEHEDALIEWAHRHWTEGLGMFSQGQIAVAEVMVYRVSGVGVMLETREWAKGLEGRLVERNEIEEVEGEMKAAEKTKSAGDEKPKRKAKKVEEDEDVRQQKRADLRASRGLRALKR